MLPAVICVTPLAITSVFNKSGDKWLFSCNCSVSDKEERVKSDNREITQEEAENVIKAAEESDLADKIKKHRPRPLSRVVFVCDETMYSSSLKFADGTNLNANCKVSRNSKGFVLRTGRKVRRGRGFLSGEVIAPYRRIDK